MSGRFRKIVPVGLVGACVLCGALLSACKQDEASSNTPAQPMNSALTQLDLDGDFLLYLSTEAVEDNVCSQIDRIAEMVSYAAADASAEAELRAGVDKVKSAVKWSGLLSLDSYAMSSKPMEDGLTRSVSLVEFSEADGQTPLWKIFYSEPKALEGIQYAPADAVYTVNGTFSLSEVWAAAMDAVSSYCAPEQAQMIQQQVMMAEMMIGTNVTAITESIDADVLVSLQLSETDTVTLPADAAALTIPEPNLLIGFKTKSPLVGEMLLEKMEMAGMPVVQSKHGAHILHILDMPLPGPVPVQLTLVVTDDYLLIGSTKDGVIRALDSKLNQDGLIATEMYQSLLRDVPEQVSSIAFMSPRCMNTYVDAVTQMLGSAGEEGALMEQMLGFYKDLYAGSYSLKSATSLYSRGYASYGGAQSAEMIATAYTGMLGAIGIPSILNAYSSSQEQAKARNVAEVEKAKGVLTLPASSGLPGAMSLHDANLELDSGEAHENLLAALRISDISELNVGEDSIVIGSLATKAHY